MALGEAVVTGAGRLSFRGIVHVAGIDDLWRGSERATRLAARNAMRAAEEHGFASLAFPLVGSGSWGLSPACSEAAILDELEPLTSGTAVTVVRYRR